MYNFYPDNGHGCMGHSAGGPPVLGWRRFIKEPYLRKWIMRINLVIFFVAFLFLQVSFGAVAQTVTLSKEGVPLKEILKEIKKQTGYDFVYRSDLLRSAQPVDIDVKDRPLLEVLDKCFSGQPVTYEIRDRTIVVKERTKPKVSSEVPTQLIPSVVVTGKVLDTTGQPLAGATVSLKGLDKRTVTDADGQFSIVANNGDVLIVTYVGYLPQSLIVADNISYQFILHDDPKGLKEIVVNTGYEHISKERATGSFDFIDNKKFNEQVGTTVLDRLAGISNSVAFNKSATGDPVTGLTIRGISTINGGRTPLIVVDNFPYNGDLNNLNPNEVESITILKDAAAASIWGAKAGNGVIVITTKHGNFNQKLSVSFNSNVSLVAKPDLFSIKMMSSSDLIDAQRVLFAGGEYDYKEQDIYGRPALPPVVELLIKERDGQLSAADADAQINALKQYDVRNDLEKYIYRQGVNQQYGFGISGGTNNIAYRFSGGYDKNLDNQDASFQRINLNSVSTFRPTKNLELSTEFHITQSTNKTGRPSYSDLLTNGVSLYSRLTDDQGNNIPIARYRQPFIDTLGGGKLLDWNYYPLEDYKHSYTNTDQLDLVVNTSLAYRINKMFRLSVNYQYERQKGDATTVNDMQSYYTRDLINSLTEIPADGSALVYPAPKGSIEDFSNTLLTSHQVRGQLNFDHSWGQSQLVALAGAEIRSASTDQRRNRIYGYDPNSSISVPVDYVNIYTNIISGFGQGIPNMDQVANQLNRFVSVFANAAYTYRDKYTISGSVRRDASNIFGATTNNRWKPLWSAGAGWDISRESFYSSEVLPRLKLRGSYGYSGNVNPAIVGVTTIGYIGSVTDYDTQQPASNFISYNNPDLRWENVGMINIGLDFGLKNNRITGSVEYYHKKTSDLYGPALTDYTAIPVFTITKNVASTAGHGIDIQLRTRNLTGVVKWTTDFNLTWYRDHVVSYYSNDTSARRIAGNNAAISLGGPNAVYGLYDYRWAGLNGQTGAPQGYLNGGVSTDYIAMGNASSRSLVYMGPSTPPIFGNIGNTVQWQNLSFTFNIIYKFGYYFQRQSINYSGLAGAGNADFAKRWQKAGDELKTNVPAFIYPTVAGSDGFYGSSSILAEKGDNIRIDYLRLNYELKPNWLKKAGIGHLDLYVAAKNFGPLWTANKDGIDPDNQYMKAPTTYSFGLNASF